MTKTEKPSVSGTSVFIGFFTIFVTLVTLANFQPKIGIWAEEATQTEAGIAPNTDAAPIKVAAVPKRRPIEAGAWGNSSTGEAEIVSSIK